MTTENDTDTRDSARGHLLHTHPVLSITLLEGALVLVAGALALMFGLRPWAAVHVSTSAVALSLTATVPLVIGMLFFERASWAWAREIRNLIRDQLLPLLRGAGSGGIALIALMAGFGEELLFRGVIQAGLAGPLGTFAALAITSLVFGLAHFVTRAYFVLATLIGLYLGLLYLWTDNLLVPILVHALYDWVALQYLLLRHPEQSESSQ